jgi:myosin heavy subunit
MDRNRDAIPSELKQLMLSTSNVLLHKIFALDPETTKKPSRKSFLKADTVTTKFKSQLGSLMDTITGTDVQYVRCIKPNSVKSRQIFDRNMVRFSVTIYLINNYI